MMMYCSTWSRFWETNALLFIVINGLFLLYANGILNLTTVAGIRFSWFFVEPFMFIALLLADNLNILKDQQAVMLYVAFFAWLMVKYLLFMWSLIDQICTYMGLRFLHVK
jgi:hypothetical protein